MKYKESTRTCFVVNGGTTISQPAQRLVLECILSHNDNFCVGAVMRFVYTRDPRGGAE